MPVVTVERIDSTGQNEKRVAALLRPPLTCVSYAAPLRWQDLLDDNVIAFGLTVLNDVLKCLLQT